MLFFSWLLLPLFCCISEWIFLFWKTTWAQNSCTFALLFVSVCIILTLSHLIMWICMTSPLSLCTGARPEICLSPKNIRIPAQEGWLGFSAARAEGQRAGGEERRGEDSRGEGRRGKRERIFSGPLPSSQILIGPPRALFPRSTGAEHGETAL